MTNDSPEFLAEDILAEVVLPVYCEWLNKWADAPGGLDTHHFTVAEFLVHDHSDEPYSIPTFHHPVGTSAAFPRMLAHFVADYGDDGGPAELFCILEARDEGWVLIHMMQGFDTYLSEIYNTTDTVSPAGETPWRHTP